MNGSHQRKPDRSNSVRRMLVTGVFWRILIIEMILLVWSLGYRAFTQPSDALDLFWYALRILILVAIIIAFVTISLRSFLNRKIILPLEAISRANLRLDTDAPEVNPVELTTEPPDEIKEIVDTRQKMLASILKVSDERLRLVNFIRDTFGRYLSRKVVDEILASPEGHKIGGRRATVTILMADLRGFTSLAETHDPEKILSLLNRFFGAMAKIIYAYDGMIDEFLGDGILAIFGVPERHDDDPARAVACALEMQNALIGLNSAIGGDGFPELKMGIGINTGKVIVGNIGSEIRSKYGIVGMPVNTASRIESITIGGQVLIGEATYMLLRPHLSVEKPQSIMMKGLRSPLVCYPVQAILSPFCITLQTRQTIQSGVPIQLPFQCWIVQEKTIQNPGMEGQTRQIMGDEMLIELPNALPEQTQLKLQLLFCTEAHCFSDIYAIVIETRAAGNQGTHHVHITGISPKDRQIMDQWISAAA
jgi:class 3 adenylate cyclase